MRTIPETELEHVRGGMREVPPEIIVDDGAPIEWFDPKRRDVGEGDTT